MEICAKHDPTPWRRLCHHTAYLRDMYGPYNVSAIHGRMLTAWSVAGIVGPLIVNGILDHYIAMHVPREQAYPLILHIIAALLMVGFFANLLLRLVAERFWMKEQPSSVTPMAHSENARREIAT
jgi:MFS family permease